MNVDLDASLLVQIVLFVVLLVFLKPLLFEPMLKLFEEREKRIEGTRREASKEDERSAKALAKYEAVLAKAREAGAAERDALRADGAKKEAEIMARVRSLAATTIEQGRTTLASEAKRTRAELTTEAATLGRAIASQVLGREVSQ
ncbi:MAG: H(+)-transporting ATPase [Labilithrix sp.]|nr:H(+)-transporting ATPase [Labilithrix sp.]